jgi:hypothetical protein
MSAIEAVSDDVATLQECARTPSLIEGHSYQRYVCVGANVSHVCARILVIPNVMAVYAV